MGWGFSDLERMIRELNAYVRANESLFQMLKEWNIDVWQLVGFNDTILSELAQGKVNKRIMYANYLKSTTNSIMMDADDKFTQRTQTFAGVADVFQQIRLGMCGTLHMPHSKVFGFAASGLNSNQDDMENYNAMVESEIREPAIPILHDVVGLSCRQLFGFEPELTITFKPLRELNATDEEEVKTSKQNRFVQLRNLGQLSGKELAELCKKEELQVMDTAVLNGADPEPPMMQMQEEASANEDETK
jgi:phage-related protein (TIGR01555 family)